MHFMRPGHQMTRRVESFPKPIIAAVNGLAFGGGCELVESTHIALAADTATFCKAEINIGIMPTFCGIEGAPGEDQFDGSFAPHISWQALCATKGRNYPNIDLSLAEGGRICRKRDVR